MLLAVLLAFAVWPPLAGLLQNNIRAAQCRAIVGRVLALAALLSQPSSMLSLIVGSFVHSS